MERICITSTFLRVKKTAGSILDHCCPKQKSCSEKVGVLANENGLLRPPEMPLNYLYKYAAWRKALIRGDKFTKWHSGKMALRKFRSKALKNKYGFTLLCGTKMYFICFSEAEKFSAIFPVALIFLWFFLLCQDKRKNDHTQSIYPLCRCCFQKSFLFRTGLKQFPFLE